MPAQTGRELLRRRLPDVEQRYRSRGRARTLGGNRGGNRRADAAGPHHQAIRTGEVEAVALRGAGEADAVEHVAVERAVRAAQDRVA